MICQIKAFDSMEKVSPQKVLISASLSDNVLFMNWEAFN